MAEKGYQELDRSASPTRSFRSQGRRFVIIDLFLARPNIPLKVKCLCHRVVFPHEGRSRHLRLVR